MSNNNIEAHECDDYARVMIIQTINEVMEYMKQLREREIEMEREREMEREIEMERESEMPPPQVECDDTPKAKTSHPDAEMFKGLTMLDDKLLPCFKLNLSQAMLEIKKNPKCVPFQIYLERWKYFNDKYKKRNNKPELPKAVINDALLPSIMMTLPIAINKIKNNPLCVPFEVYLKRWNQLKTIKNHEKLTNN